MKPLSLIVDFFKPPSIEEIILIELRVEEQVVIHCNATISTALFQRSLSLAKIKALREWTTVHSTTSTSRKESSDHDDKAAY